MDIKNIGRPNTNNASSSGDEFRTSLVCCLNSIKGEVFWVTVSEGPYCNRQLKFFERHLYELTPLIPHETEVLLGVKGIKGKADKDEKLIVLFAKVLKYHRVTDTDIRLIFETAVEFSHEEFIEKLYFSWRPFLKCILTCAKYLSADTLAWIMILILPPTEKPSNRQHNHRFREIIELFVSEESTFHLRLYQLKAFDKELVKRFVQTATSFAMKLDPVVNLLEKYYGDDPRGLINLIKSCSRNEDPSASLEVENYRHLALIPLMEELAGVVEKLNSQNLSQVERKLLQLESHLKPNRILGQWDSAEQFLNVHFRLLREECFALIRNRIADVRKECSEAKFHRDVKVVAYAVAEGTIVVKLKYTPHKGQVNLMFGNLVCIDKDTNFSCPVWATVQTSDTKSKTISVIVVGLGGTDGSGCSGLSSDILVSALQHLMSCSSGVMVESPTYYHAFKMVLSGLQNINETNFPFASEVLVRSINPIRSPLNFNIVCNQKMDASQRGAVEMALTSRFTLIQGPPGCGKTFVGKEIIKGMLESKKTKSSFQGPILLMTYKNHALDSMLEGCLEFTQSVVRIGGRSASERIAAFNLNKLHKESKEYHSQEDFRKLQDAKSNLPELETELKEAWNYYTEFTPQALIRFLKDDDIGASQLHSLLSHNFRENFKILTEKNTSYLSTPTSIHDAVNDILLDDPDLAERLLKCSLRNWLTDAHVRKYLPQHEESLILTKRTPKKNKNENADESEAEEYDQVFAERQVEPESRYEFLDISQNKNRLYPDLLNAISYIVSDRREHDIRQVRDVWDLKLEGRYILLSLWIREWRKGKDEHLAKALDRYNTYQQQVKQLEDKRHVEFLKSRDLVACTITGCCLKIAVISEMAPSIVIVEEAAEILESQLIAALPSSVKHIVLIGDHKQLPPQVHHYRLVKHYNMAVSIFERLANNGYPIQQLRFHRRGPQSLCPLFSRFYEHAIEATNPDGLPPKTFEKLGIAYWWTHNAESTVSHPGTSLQNELEAAMVVGSARFLIVCGEVQPEQITIITGYLGQSKLIKKLLADQEVEGVGVCTVDRFQGDENDFIFLSLTRNEKPDPSDKSPPSLGFLRSDNRICVALSRAKRGLYVFGSSSFFETNPTWKATIDFFRSQKKLGKELQLVPNGKVMLFDHPNDFTLMFNQLDLQKREKKMELHNIFANELQTRIARKVPDLEKKIEELMNKSVIDKKDLGMGRDAHGQKFSKFKVIKVEDVYDDTLYLGYLNVQKKIEKRNPAPLAFPVDSMADWLKKLVSNKKVNEFFFFHGTDPATAEVIKKDGFDMRVSRLGGMFGAGIYFAENADKSDQYVRVGPPYMMFLARVTLGVPHMTSVSQNLFNPWRRPPPINPANPFKVADSIVALSQRKAGQGAVERHQEFIVFDNYQCVPEYLISYERQ